MFKRYLTRSLVDLNYCFLVCLSQNSNPEFRRHEAVKTRNFRVLISLLFSFQRTTTKGASIEFPKKGQPFRPRKIKFFHFFCKCLKLIRFTSKIPTTYARVIHNDRPKRPRQQIARKQERVFLAQFFVFSSN